MTKINPKEYLQKHQKRNSLKCLMKDDSVPDDSVPDDSVSER